MKNNHFSCHCTLQKWNKNYERALQISWAFICHWYYSSFSGNFLFFLQVYVSASHMIKTPPLEQTVMLLIHIKQKSTDGRNLAFGWDFFDTLLHAIWSCTHWVMCRYDRNISQWGICQYHFILCLGRFGFWLK